MSSTTATATAYNPYAPSASNSNQGYGGGLNGSSPPSIYLICFIVIILVLLSVSSLLALRTISHRRRLHAAWARAGYSDAFFDSPYYRENAPRGGLTVAQRWGAHTIDTLGGGGSGRSKGETKYGRKPHVWEVEGVGLEEVEDKGLTAGSHGKEETDATMVGTWRGEKGKGRAPSRYDDLAYEVPKGWEGIMPISTTLLLPPPPPSSSKTAFSSNLPVSHSAPSFWSTVRTVPTRPPPPPPAPLPEPIPTFEILDSPTWPAFSSSHTNANFSHTSSSMSGDAKELEVSVLIALPMEDGWEDKLDRDDGERELPDVALGVATVRLGAMAGGQYEGSR